MINIFYWLILIQAILILITFNISTNPQIADNILEYFNLKRIITNQCGNISICQDAIKLIESINIIEIQINQFQAQHFCYLFIYPLILILKQFNKERNFFRNMAFWFHWIQYPFLYLFVQKLSFIIKHHFPELIMPFNICFGLFILNLTFFIINQQFLGIGIQNKRKPLYILFFLLVLNLLYNIITVNNYNWIPYLMINAYIQIYLIHIDSNLFQNNQYYEHNKPLIKILFERISFLNRDNQKNRFVIKKDKAMFIFIIIPCILYFRETLLQSNVLFTIISIIIKFVLFIQWDTSLVSTSSNLELEDQWLAADLFFLDLFVPIRNIVMFLLLD